MAKVHFDIHSGVALLRLDNPPVNSLGAPLRAALVQALERANAQSDLAAIVLIGSESVFSGGADIREFGTPEAQKYPDLRAVLAAVEDSPKPVIAAIGGVCMGGGLELALACHYRVAIPGGRIALPEVKLGLLPGAGGTQRLPRVLGLEAALNLIVSGATASSESLAGTPLFDDFGPGDLATRALAFAQRLIAEGRGPKKVRDLRIEMPNAEAFLQFARNTVKSVAGPYPAPLACVEAVAASTDRPFDAGIKRERELFASLMLSPESAALRHVFHAERAAAKILDMPAGVKPRPIRSTAVIGAGTMGGGIAMSLINAGLPVVLIESSQEALERGLATMRRNYQGSLRKGTLSEAQLAQRLALITPTLDYAQLADVDLVIEAVFESMDVKRAVFERLDKTLRKGAILASNTSALDLDQIAQATSRPGDVIGLHFFSPAHIMRLLEVVRGRQTALDVLATAMQLAKTLGKVAVVSRVCDGFIGNRMLARYAGAAHDLLMMGATPQKIDAALEGFGMAMGPFRVGDLAGLDIGWALRKRRGAQMPDKDFSNAADLLCAAGRFGQKTGAGWYRYEPNSRTALPDPTVEQMIAQFREQRGILPRAVDSAEIVERCIYALINEGARILEDGTAQRSSDIDIVYLNGYGFPASRGGPMFYADQIGLPRIDQALARMPVLPLGDAQALTAAPLLSLLAREGRTFSAYKG